MKKAGILFITMLQILLILPFAIQPETVLAEVMAEEAMTEVSVPKYPSVPHMSLEDYPEVDGSLACIPLMQALVMEVTGCTQREAEDSLKDFSNTNPSYERLMAGEADLILSYEASADTKDFLTEAEASGDNAIELQPVGRDALVFITNAGNPVTELSTQQIHDIYKGEITNWREVGGEDIEIRAFQRRENSGSQTLMRLLLMGDETIPEKQMISISEMEGLLNTVMEYDNSSNALGYSVYYYASVMMGNDRLKFLAVNGISPNNDTIRSGAYTLSHPFWCGISRKSSENALIIRDWLLSEEGQRFVEDHGYVGAGSAGAEDPKEGSSSSPASGSQLFDPDLYLGIAAGTYRSAGGEAPDMMIRYYDSTGAFRGEAVGSVDYFTGTFRVIQKGRLMYSYKEDDVVILRTEDLGEVCRYDRDEQFSGRVCEATEHVGILSRDGSHLVIYDRDGQIFADLKTAGPAIVSADPTAEDTGSEQPERTDLVIYEPEGYLYVCLTAGNRTLLKALIRDDGSVLTSEDPSFPELLRTKQACSFIGKNLIFRDEPDGYLIADPEGNVLVKAAQIHRAEHSGYVVISALDRADFAALRQGDGWVILDETLTIAGTISDQDLDPYGHLRYAQGTIIGLPCEALGGLASTDILTYLRQKVPAAKIPGGYRVFDDLGSFLPDPGEGWELSDFSDSFILQRSADIQRVVRRSDGQILLETAQQVYLQNTSFVVQRDYMDPESMTVIYDEDMQVLYTCKERIFTCMEDLYYLHRGPWAGVTDAHGTWLLRELQYDE